MGGTRGIVTVAVLDRMDRVLCGDDPAARLSDHFDLIYGTSMGGITDASVALGWRVADTKAIDTAFAHGVFWRRWYRLSPLMNRYDTSKRAALLTPPLGHDAHGGALLLGSLERRTGLP